MKVIEVLVTKTPSLYTSVEFRNEYYLYKIYFCRDGAFILGDSNNGPEVVSCRLKPLSVLALFNHKANILKSRT